MANGLSMKVLLQLQKSQFDKGIASVKQSIAGLGRTIKSVAGMIVGGLGLNALMGQFKDAAQQMSVMKATMENVSNGYREYAENMEFIKRISNEYGQDLISLGNGFAKFHAAAKQTNLSLDQQRDIFEALTKAAGAYHLSAEQTSNVMLAVEQMLSKGKVTAEELRRQLGNSLPGAFNLMAQAAGMAGVTVNGTTAELEAAMKAGKVMSEDVLPHFAQILNATTQAANFDSLQSSLNRFRNSWVSFVENSGFEGAFKGLVDFGTRSLNTLSEHTDSFKRLLISGLGGALAWVGVNGFKKLQAEGEKNLPPLVKEIRGITKGLDETDSAIKRVESEFNALKNSSKATHTGLIGREDIQYIENLSKEEEKLLKKVTARGHQVAIEQSRYEALCRLDNKRNDLLKQRGELQGKLSQYDESAITGVRKVNVALEGAKSIGKALLSTIGGIALNMAAAFAVSLIVNWIAKIVQAAKEAERLKNMVKDTQAEAEKAAGVVNEQIGRMDALLKIVQDVNQSEQLRERALKQINRLLGNQKFTLEDIETNSNKVTSAIDRWKTSLINAARASAYFSKIQELEARKIDLETKRNEITSKPGYEKYASHAVMNGAGIKTPIGALTDDAKQVAKFDKEIGALDDSINNLLNTMKKEGLNNPFEDIEDGITSTEAVRTALDNYRGSLADLDSKLKKGSISTKKYNRDVNKLREDTLKSIQKYDDWEDVVESLGGEYEKLAGQLQRTSNISTKKSPLAQLKDDLDDFKKDKSALDNVLASGKMSGDEYAKTLENLVNKYRDNIFGVDDLANKLNSLGQKYKDIVDEFNEAINDVKLFSDIDEAIKAQDKVLETEFEKSLDKIQKYFEKSAEIMNDGVPRKKKKEEGFFAYKDGLHESLGRYAKDAEDYVKELEKVKNKILELKKYSPLDPFMQKMLDEIIEKLRVATNEAGALRDAANFAELSQDIKELKKELAADTWGAWSEGVVGAAGRINSALAQLNEVAEGDLFDEEMIEQVSKLLSVLDSLNQIVETISGTFKMFNSIIETNKKLQEAQAAMTTLTGGAKVKALAAETVAEATSAAATKSAEAAKTAAIAKTTSALAGQAVAGATSSGARLPFPYNLIAIAAGVTAVAAALATMSKYAGGGIVGGSKTQGDQNVARVNSGEMILNKAQQGNLWSIINGKGGLGGQVEFVLRGDRLVGAINNYNSRRRG